VDVANADSSRRAVAELEKRGQAFDAGTSAARHQTGAMKMIHGDGPLRSFGRDEPAGAGRSPLLCRGVDRGPVLYIQHLGINRGSLYATFGSKEELYQRALNRCLDESIEWFDQTLASQTEPCGNGWVTCSDRVR
jgi:hypothetical protein